MKLDADALAARAAARLGLKFRRQDLRDVIAAAVVVGVNQALSAAAELVTAERLAGAVNRARRTPVSIATRRHLAIEAAQLAGDIRALRLPACPDDTQEGPAGASAPPPSPSSPR